MILYILNFLGLMIFGCYVYFIYFLPYKRNNFHVVKENEEPETNEEIFDKKEFLNKNINQLAEDITFTSLEEESDGDVFTALKSTRLKRRIHEPSPLRKVKSSTELREFGNSFYHRASDPGICPALKKSRLQSALESYHEALSVCNNALERSSAYKNRAVASRRLAEVMMQEKDEKLLYRKHFRESLTNYVSALASSEGRSDEWQKCIKESIDDTVKEVIEEVKTREEDFKSKASALQSYLAAVDCSSSRIIQELLGLRYEEGKNLFLQKFFDGCLHEFYECKRLYQDLQQCDSAAKPCITLEEINVYIKISESIKGRNSGDQMLKKLLEQGVPITAIFYESVIAKFKEAANCAHLYDVIEEATSWSRLGHVYDILVDKVQATKYFRKCLAVLESFPDKDKYIDTDWYTNCNLTLQRYKDSIVVQESDRWYQVRQVFLPEVADDVADLKSRKTHVQFLMHLYNRYPPKNKNNAFTSLEENEGISNKSLKKMYLKARLHYSPDKVDVTKHGKRWKVFCEEVSVLLNSRAETILND